MTAPTDRGVQHEDRLDRLVSAMTKELDGRPGHWCAVRLASGFLAALMMDETGKRRVRLRTEWRPEGTERWKAWHANAERIAQHMGIVKWEIVAPAEPYSGAVVEYAEPTVTDG
jgi:hypothetical protein